MIRIRRWLPVLLGGWFSYHWFSRRAIRPLHRSSRGLQVASAVPTLFIPGWGGNAWTYNGMLRWFARHGYASKVLTVRVDYRGRLHFTGTWTGAAENPTIQVLFDRNLTQGYQHQIRWITQILRALRQHYGITTYNAVAHSWGGSAMVQSLLRDGADPQLLRLNRLVLLGTPVDESGDLHVPDPAYRRLWRWRGNLWANAGAEIHNVYGFLAGRKTDGEVPVRQARALRPVVAGSPLRYAEYPLAGLGHSRLHSARIARQLIARLLWAPKQND
ncbi:alpha/beta hydrolase [Levilactobacillus suantsaii]|uniref:alpha/beta hydrolase n=1 Tax=Levilactobacillus suantsaii TaxID=2292255 RepID=UPI001CDD4271|nr:alpha/beta hydrolase [Levilactobacillus suantsaii]